MTPGPTAKVGPAQPPGYPVAVPRRALANPFRLPVYRFVPRVSFHPSYGSALYIARGQGYAVDRWEHCVRAAAPPATIGYPAPPRLLAFRDTAGRIDFSYRAAAGGFFVAAATFDDGWRATVDGRPRAVYRTAVGQLGVELPPGQHRLLLAYRERLLPLGAAISLAALCGCALALALLPRGPKGGGQSRPQEPAETPLRRSGGGQRLGLSEDDERGATRRRCPEASPAGQAETLPAGA